MKLNVLVPQLPSVLQAKIDGLFGKLPEMKVVEGNFYDPENYRGNEQLWSVDQIHDISGAFFDVRGYVVKNGDLTWFQPGIRQVEENDLVGLVVGLAVADKDGKSAGRIWLAANEPFRKVHACLRNVQTSAAKLKKVLAGEKDLDPSLAAFLELGIDLGKQSWYPADTAHDGNRLGGVVGYTTVRIPLQAAEKLAEKLGGAYFTQDEVEILKIHGRHLFNNHALFTLV